jgi:polyisoprenoid-binding protein YceI
VVNIHPIHETPGVTIFKKQKPLLMKKHLFLAATVVLMITSAFTFFQAQTWKIADGYSVKFDGGDPSGEFTGLKGSILFDENNLAASKFDVTVDVASINTGNGMKNTHAKSANWFDAEKYPTIHFTSNTITKTATGYDAKGTLEMHGKAKETTIPFTFANNTFSSAFEVNRHDFALDDGKHEKMLPNMRVALTVPVTK